MKKMRDHLLVGLLALATGIGLAVIERREHGESLRLMRFHSAVRFYRPIVLVFLAMGIAELVAGAAATKWWLAMPIVSGR
jgi:hypothetical protein